MKTKLCFCLAILMFACSKSSKEKIKYFPDKAFFDGNIPVEIDLDSNQITFKEISREIRKYYGSDSIPYLQLNNNGQVSRLGFMAADTSLIRERKFTENHKGFH